MRAGHAPGSRVHVEICNPRFHPAKTETLPVVTDPSLPIPAGGRLRPAGAAVGGHHPRGPAGFQRSLPAPRRRGRRQRRRRRRPHSPAGCRTPRQDACRRFFRDLVLRRGIFVVAMALPASRKRLGVTHSGAARHAGAAPHASSTGSIVHSRTARRGNTAVLKRLHSGVGTQSSCAGRAGFPSSHFPRHAHVSTLNMNVCWASGGGSKTASKNAARRAKKKAAGGCGDGGDAADGDGTAAVTQSASRSSR